MIYAPKSQCVVQQESLTAPALCSQNKKNAGTKLAPAVTCGGDDGVRTHDLRLAKPALSQLSYVPESYTSDAEGQTNKHPSGDSASAGVPIGNCGGPDKARTCDLPVISRTL